MADPTNIPIQVPSGFTDKLLSELFLGDTRSIIAILICIVIYLAWDKHRIAKDLKEKDTIQRTELLELIEKHHKSKLETNEALHSLQIVLIKIESRI